MNTLVEKAMGMDTITDQIIAFDVLIAAKTAVRNLGIAITETVTPEVRAVLMKQLKEANDTHEQITNYVVKKGWYHPHNVTEQIKFDLQCADTALTVAKG